MRTPETLSALRKSVSVASTAFLFGYKQEAAIDGLREALALYDAPAPEPPPFEPCRVVAGCVRRDGHPSFHCTSDQIAAKEDRAR